MPLSKNPYKRGRQMAHVRQGSLRVVPITVLRYEENGKRIVHIIGIKGNFVNHTSARSYAKKYVNLRLDKAKSRYPEGTKATILLYKKNQRQIASRDLMRYARKSHKTSFRIHKRKTVG